MAGSPGTSSKSAKHSAADSPSKKSTLTPFTKQQLREITQSGTFKQALQARIVQSIESSLPKFLPAEMQSSIATSMLPLLEKHTKDMQKILNEKSTAVDASVAGLRGQVVEGLPLLHQIPLPQAHGRNIWMMLW